MYKCIYLFYMYIYRYIYMYIYLHLHDIHTRYYIHYIMQLVDASTVLSTFSF